MRTLTVQIGEEIWMFVYIHQKFETKNIELIWLKIAKYFFY